MTNYKISFSGGNHGCGCGCEGNDLNIASQNQDYDFYFSGDEASAQLELKRLEQLHGNYRCDVGGWTLNKEKPLLVVISGPSGVGKGPIIEWAKKLYFPNLHQVKVRKTKTERHTGIEDDLGFNNNSGDYYQFDCRGAEQRLYLDELDLAVEKNDIVLLETYYKSFDFLKDRYAKSEDVYFVSVFISPLDSTDLLDMYKYKLKLDDYLPSLMLDSLIMRSQKEGKVLTDALNLELEKRAEDSVNELRFAHNYSNIITNHCYESDSRWKLPVLIGEPKKVVSELDNIIKCNYSKNTKSGYLYLYNL